MIFDIDFTVKKVSERDEVHVWYHDRAGRPTRMRHAADTLQQQRAWDGTT